MVLVLLGLTVLVSGLTFREWQFAGLGVVLMLFGLLLGATKT